MKKMRTAALVLLGMVLLATQVVATGKSEPAPAAKKSVTIIQIQGSSESGYGDIQGLAKKFEQQTGIKIEFQFIPDDQRYMYIQTRLASAESLDTFGSWTGNEQLQWNCPQNCVDLSDQPWVSRINPALLESSVKYGWGKVFSVPFREVTIVGLMYNQKIFADNNLQVPKTFADFEKVCETLKAKGITPIYMPLKEGWTQLQFVSTMYSRVFFKRLDLLEKLNANQMKWNDAPNLISNWDKLYEWVTKGYFNPDMGSATYEMQLNEFAAGKVGMIFQGDWIIGELKKRTPDVSDQVGVMGWPTENGDTVIDTGGVAGFFISKNSKNVDACKQWFSYLASPEVLESWFKVSPGTPPWIGVPSPLTSVQKSAKPYLDAAKVGPHVYSMYVAPGPYDKHGKEVASFLLGQISADELVTAMANDWIDNAKALKIKGF